MNESDVVDLRDLETSDIHDVEVIWRTSGLVGDDEDAVAEITMLLALPLGICIGAMVNGALVGVVFGQDEHRRGWMGRLAVHPEFQRRGVGRALVFEMERRLIEREIPRVELYVYGANEAATRFYAGLGYRQWPELVVTTKWFTSNGR